MKQTLLQEKYPVYTLEVAKDETSRTDAAAIISGNIGNLEVRSHSPWLRPFAA